MLSIVAEIGRQFEEARDHTAMFVKISPTTNKQFVALAIFEQRHTQSKKTYSIHLNDFKSGE
ncbi:MAG: hypothetical protein MUQ51_01370 [Pseudomonadota bacterium]|nr:hypothetical protein [Pseudomonadota bacterium]